MEKLSEVTHSLIATLQSIGHTAVDTVGDVTQHATTHELYMAGGVVAATLLGIYLLPGFLRRRESARLRQQRWQQCRNNIAKLKEKLERRGELTREKREEIVELSLQKLIDKLQAGSLTAVHVLEAYQTKAQQVCNIYNNPYC